MRRCQHLVLNYSGKWGSGGKWKIPAKGMLRLRQEGGGNKSCLRNCNLLSWWWWDDLKRGGWGMTRLTSWRATIAFILKPVELLIYTWYLGPWAQQSHGNLNPGCRRCSMRQLQGSSPSSLPDWALILTAGLRPREALTISVFTSDTLVSAYLSKLIWFAKTINAHYRINLSFANSDTKRWQKVSNCPKFCSFWIIFQLSSAFSSWSSFRKML